MKHFKIIFCTALLSMFSVVFAEVVTHSGIRVSQYGIDPMPLPKGLHNAIYTMNTYFPGTIPTIVWTVGEFWDENEECHMNFPNDGGYPTTNLSYEDNDLCESYFTYFDGVGIKVFMQIEPGKADIKKVIDMVFKRYGKHSCIIGFGVDVEFYDCVTNVWGKKVTDTEAQEWEKLVKTYKTTHKLFLKHPDKTPTRFPTTYRGEIIFDHDCEGRAKKADPAGFASYDEFLKTSKAFADAFSPNPVIFQIGYPSIKKLWESFNPKPLVVGNDLAKQCKVGQNVQIYWVDFGMEGVLPYSNTWTPLPWPTTSIKQTPFVNKENCFTLNPDEIFNFSAIALNGRVLFSMTGTGNKILQDFNGWNSVHTGNNVFIYRIDNKNGQNSFLTTRKVIVK